MAAHLKRFLPCVVVCVMLGGGPVSIASGAVVYAAGDIACDPTDANFNNGLGSATACRQKYTADIISNEIDAGRAPDAIIALGDLQYNSASLSNFNASYALSWGRPPLKSRTRPVIGNHEGSSATSGAGYCSYFGAAAHCNSSGRQGNAAFYSFNVGDWHVAVINSNCTAAGGCEVGSPQYQWLVNDLDANAGKACTMAVWHHARWSTGHDGNNTFMQPIWQLFYDKGGDLALAGHSHDYERFAPIDGSGAVNRSNGIRSFVVGTGGAFFTGLGGTPVAGSEVRQNKSYGVLKLTLNPTSYAWEWVTAAGSPAFSDSGTQACRTSGGGSDTEAPTVPGTPVSGAVTGSSVGLSWSASSDNVGVTGYRVLRDGVQVGTTAGGVTSFTDSGLSPSTTYGYAVMAVDAAGNVSAASGTLSVTTSSSGGGPLTFAATDDATIDQANPTAAASGTSSRLTADGSPVSDFVVRFVVAGTGSGTSCPSITAAKLRLTVGSTADDRSPRGGDFSVMAGAGWSESTVTWNSAPARGAVVASLGAVALNTAYLVDLTSANVVTGNGAYTIRVSSTSSDGARYFSRNGNPANVAPELQISCGAP